MGSQITATFINVQIITTIVHKMTTILKPGIEKILNIFYKNQNQQTHLRELSRMTKMHGQSITRYLKALEKEGILKSEKKGNLKQYSLRMNKKACFTRALFDIEKFEKLPDMRKSAVAAYIRKLPEMPVFIVLFGSTAKETYTAESDMDLLLIANRKIQARDAEKEADALNAVKISTFQMTYSDFIKELKLKEDNVVQSALQTGYPLMNHLFYYEALQNEGI